MNVFIKRMALLLLLAVMSAAPASAADQYQFRGKVSGPEGTIRGKVTISENALEVQKSCLWIRESLAYDFKDTKGIRVRRGLLRMKVRVREAAGGGYVQIKTWAWHYEPVRQLLKEKL